MSCGFKTLSLTILWFLFSNAANATLIGFPSCSGANDCLIVDPTDSSSPYFSDTNADGKNEITANPNNGLLITWNEQQNVTLTSDLPVDRVADSTLSFIGGTAGNFFIKAGTVVTSHYLQWDPGDGSSSSVEATIGLDSDIIAFITNDQKLFDTDTLLGLTALDYADFGLRGLESGDSTLFGTDLTTVDIDWTASSPGDWTRLIAAFSPSADDPDQTEVPEPFSWAIFILGLAILVVWNRKQERVCY